MAETGSDFLTDLTVTFGVGDAKTLDEFTVREVNLTESILTPGLMTSMKVDAYVHNPRDLDLFKGAPVSITVNRPILARYGPNGINDRNKYKSTLSFTNHVYRIQDRKLVNNNNENMVLQACHETQLEDARKLMSFPWTCTTPSDIVSQVLTGCLGSGNNNVEPSQPARDYTAENIHPFQVISQQSDVALAGGNDPSFLHFMTYENDCTHNFRSLYTMTKQDPVAKFKFSETGTTTSATGEDKGYMNPNAVITHSFPCDFDLLSDLLNGINLDGGFIGAIIVENVKNAISSALGFQPGFCSTAATLKVAESNVNTEDEQLSCPIDVQTYLLKRQARMGMIERDKIALRLTVPWNASLNAGKVISFERFSLDFPDVRLYGSGEYLIHSLTHIIKSGGYSTTVMDCVSTTIGQGIT
jgi:hypothetical protein